MKLYLEEKTKATNKIMTKLSVVNNYYSLQTSSSVGPTLQFSFAKREYYQCFEGYLLVFNPFKVVWINFSLKPV